MRNKKGFTLIELLVVIAIIALLVSILLPSLTRARELAKQAICGTRLKGLGNAFALYQNSYNDNYPLLARSALSGETTFSNDYENDPHKANGSDKKDALKRFFNSEYDCNIQHTYLLVEHGFCGVDQFQCPSDSQYQSPERSGNEVGFGSWYNVSYAFQPFTPGTGDSESSTNAAYPGRSGQDGAVIIAGDKQERGKETWTINHNTYGGNFLSINQSVAFKKAEFNMVGWNKNHAYNIDIDEDGDLDKDPEDVEDKNGIPDLGNGLPKYINDSALFWKADD
jgi:prepilin-type N-terminal cleavage/methylation domain-containing protein